MDRYIVADGKRLRCGITTGTCAAAAAQAAAWLLLRGVCVERARVRLPDGSFEDVPIEQARMDGASAVATVIKDAGDDPDVTGGMPVCVSAVRIDSREVQIEGGSGVGRVTLPGLDQPVGAAAINSVPRSMITQAVRDVLDAASDTGGVRVTVSLPWGEALAKRTFNPRMGIVGGLSVLGTSGIVEPMSENALIETIRVEIRMRAATGKRVVLFAPGNYGRDYLAQHCGIDGDSVIRISNFAGDALLAARDEGFQGVLFTAHLGKLVKLAGNMLNTHSRYGDCRMEILTAHAARFGLSRSLAERILASATVDAALNVLDEENLTQPVLNSVLEAAQRCAQRKCELPVEMLTFTNARGFLAKTDGFDVLLAVFRGEEG